jgi:predicted 3-demethylubiquinone-9 3-methyltransferase (glyoxalase superfamily)
MAIGQKITPFLWFDNNAEEAVGFYTSIFKNSRIVTRSRCGDAGPGPKGSILAIAFKLEGQDFVALNGGPHFKFTEAISLYINCETQEEIERFWSKLVAGGEEHDCGWLKDRYGLSWQVNYAGIQDMMSDSHPDRADRVMQAMLKMKKIDIQRLKDAHEGRWCLRRLDRRMVWSRASAARPSPDRSRRCWPGRERPSDCPACH